MVLCGTYPNRFMTTGERCGEMHLAECRVVRKRLREEELRGLREDKMKPIRSFAKFLAEDAA